MQLHPDTLQFFDELYLHNDRDWFLSQKPRYEAIRAQFLEFTQALIDEVRLLDPTIGSVEATKCVYRIYRDVRFSHDKRPYKTHIACFLATGGDRTKPMPGYYFQLGRQDEYQLSGTCTLGGGIWCPEPKALEAIRQEIFYCPDEFESIITNPEYQKYFGTEFWTMKKLTRVPKGFSADWEHADWLKYRDYVSMYQVPNELLFTDQLFSHVLSAIRATVPLNKFIQRALSL